jgi:hypothetical protein
VGIAVTGQASAIGFRRGALRGRVGATGVSAVAALATRLTAVARRGGFGAAVLATGVLAALPLAAAAVALLARGVRVRGLAARRGRSADAGVEVSACGSATATGA